MATIPKPASTVVLLDDFSRVYLTKRPKSMRFMGGFHVFPGGAVEEKDHVINSDYINSGGAESSLSHTHYIAGARELFEEVGILLGKKKDGTPVRLEKETEVKYRSKLSNGELSFSQVLEQENLFLDLQSLKYFGQIITPKRSKIRFDTRFFLTKLPQGQDPEPNETEVEEAFWMTPEEALNAFRNKKIRLAPPTIMSLEAIISYQKGGALMISATEDDLLRLIKTYEIPGII